MEGLLAIGVIALWIIVWGLLGIGAHALAVSRQEAQPDQLGNYIGISVQWGWAIAGLMVMFIIAWACEWVGRRTVVPPVLWLSAQAQRMLSGQRVQRWLNRVLPKSEAR